MTCCAMQPEPMPDHGKVARERRGIVFDRVDDRHAVQVLDAGVPEKDTALVPPVEGIQLRTQRRRGSGASDFMTVTVAANASCITCAG